MKVTLACAQFVAKVADKAYNIKSMESWIDKIKEKNPEVKLIVFPELALTGYECGTQFDLLSESFPEGPSLKKMGEIAKTKNVHVIFGFIEKVVVNNKIKLYNSAVLIDDEGKAVGKYRKSHLVEEVETLIFHRGTEYPVFDTKIGKIGMMICWDSAYPEVARILALKGADIIAVPAAWEEPNGDDWDLVQCARSFDNVIYIAACNRVGTDDQLTFFGRSKIVGPTGKVVVETDHQESFICAEVDLDLRKQLQKDYYNLLSGRQYKTYEILLTEGGN